MVAGCRVRLCDGRPARQAGRVLDTLPRTPQTAPMTRASFIAFSVLLAGPALALDEPVTWRDPDSGCRYWLTPQGGIAPRYRRDGQPDCPDVASADPRQPLEALRREVERLFGRGKTPE